MCRWRLGTNLRQVRVRSQIGGILSLSLRSQKRSHTPECDIERSIFDLGFHAELLLFPVQALSTGPEMTIELTLRCSEIFRYEGTLRLRATCRSIPGLRTEHSHIVAVRPAAALEF